MNASEITHSDPAAMFAGWKGDRRMVEIKTVNQASKLLRAFTDKHDLGASETPTLLIYGTDRQPIGHVSYNGRVWDNRTGQLIYDPTSNPFGRERAAPGCVFEQPAHAIN